MAKKELKRRKPKFLVISKDSGLTLGGTLEEDTGVNLDLFTPMLTALKTAANMYFDSEIATLKFGNDFYNIAETENATLLVIYDAPLKVEDLKKILEPHDQEVADWSLTGSIAAGRSTVAAVGKKVDDLTSKVLGKMEKQKIGKVGRQDTGEEIKDMHFYEAGKIDENFLNIVDKETAVNYKNIKGFYDALSNLGSESQIGEKNVKIYLKSNVDGNVMEYDVNRVNSTVRFIENATAARAKLAMSTKANMIDADDPRVQQTNKILDQFLGEYITGKGKGKLQVEPVVGRGTYTSKKLGEIDVDPNGTSVNIYNKKKEKIMEFDQRGAKLFGEKIEGKIKKKALK